jgi:hypothetical protein
LKDRIELSRTSESGWAAMTWCAWREAGARVCEGGQRKVEGGQSRGELAA